MGKINALIDKFFGHTHKYSFKQAWEAVAFDIHTSLGEVKQMLLTCNDDPIIEENQIKDLIDEEREKDFPYRKRYLINLKCKCGHRITVQDEHFHPKHSA